MAVRQRGPLEEARQSILTLMRELKTAESSEEVARIQRQLRLSVAAFKRAEREQVGSSLLVPEVEEARVEVSEPVPMDLMDALRASVEAATRDRLQRQGGRRVPPATSEAFEPLEEEIGDDDGEETGEDHPSPPAIEAQ